jgi:hypothetical protein
LEKTTPRLSKWGTMISRKGYPMSRNHGKKRKQKSLDRKITRTQKEVFSEEEIKDHIKYSEIWKAKYLYSLIVEMIS